MVVFTQNIHILTIFLKLKKLLKIHTSEKNGHHRNVSSASQLLYVVKSAIVLSDSLRENDEINFYTDEDIAIEQMMRWHIELLDILNKKSALKILAPLFELKRTSAGTNMKAFFGCRRS